MAVIQRWPAYTVEPVYIVVTLGTQPVGCYTDSNFFTVTTHTFRPDGKELAVATLDGQISFWDPLNAIQTGSIEGRNDLHVGRRETDRVTAKKLAGVT